MLRESRVMFQERLKKDRILPLEIMYIIITILKWKKREGISRITIREKSIRSINFQNFPTALLNFG